MGYTAAESHIHADELGDTFSDDMVERINERLGFPDRCPHGWPIETAVEQAENAELVSLADLSPGSAAEIVRLAEHDGDLLHWFYENGFAPGVTVLRQVSPVESPFVVELDGGERTIDEKFAQGLYVRPAA
jgi:DtxR family Mn-dependent transcriptional regulator